MVDDHQVETAFVDLYRSTYRSVDQYCRRRLSADQTGDAIAEIYSVAWAEVDQFVTADEPLAWLHAVGFRVVSSQYRKNMRVFSLAKRLAAQPARIEYDLEAQAAANDEFERSLAALQALSPFDQEVISLVAFEELGYKQLGVAIGRSESAAKTAVYRARQRLRAEFEQQSEDGR